MFTLLFRPTMLRKFIGQGTFQNIFFKSNNNSVVIIGFTVLNQDDNGRYLG